MHLNWLIRNIYIFTADIFSRLTVIVVVVVEIVVIRLRARDSRGFSELRSRKRKRWYTRESSMKSTNGDSRRRNFSYPSNYGSPASRQNSVFFSAMDTSLMEERRKADGSERSQAGVFIGRWIGMERHGAPSAASSFSWFAISYLEWLASAGFLGQIRRSDFWGSAWDIISRPILDAQMIDDAWFSTSFATRPISNILETSSWEIPLEK